MYTHCTSHPVKAKNVFAFLESKNKILFNPQKSSDHPEHYKYFLEMCELELQVDDSA